MRQQIQKYLGIMLISSCLVSFKASAQFHSVTGLTYQQFSFQRLLQPHLLNSAEIEQQTSSLVDKTLVTKSSQEVTSSPIWLTPEAYVLYLIILLMGAGFFYYIRVHNHRIHMRLLAQISHSEQQLQLALWSSGDEFWDWEIKHKRLTRSNTFIKYPEKEISLKRTITSSIHPDDWLKMTQALKSCLYEGKDELHIKYRSKSLKGNWLWVANKAKVVERNSRGKATRIAGIIQNIQPLKEDELALQSLAKTLEQRVIERTKQLELCQKQLDSLLDDLNMAQEQLSNRNMTLTTNKFLDLDAPLEVCLAATHKLQRQIQAFNHKCDEDTLYREDFIAYQKSLSEGCELLVNKLERIANLINKIADK